jgi:hypothetical protein
MSRKINKSDFFYAVYFGSSLIGLMGIIILISFLHCHEVQILDVNKGGFLPPYLV